MEGGEVVVRQKSARPEGEEVVGVEEGGEGAPESAGAEKKRAGPPGIEAVKPGMQIKGKVRKVVDFGAFVDIGVGRDGLVHISALKRAGMDKKIRAGQVLDIVVRRVDMENGRISLVIPGQRRKPKMPLQDLRVDSVVSGRVVRLVDFGAFVDIGARADGLLHVSQLPSGYASHPREVLHVGDRIRVRILGVDARKRRISLSMRESEGETVLKEAAEAAENRSHMPTAFEVAFQEALAHRRRRQRRAGR